MVEQLKNTLLYNWTLLRIMRLGIGLIALYQAVEAHDWMIGTFAVLLLSQGLFNWGCCGAQGCAPKQTVKDNNKTEEVK
jgi:hypothetical protein